jgi:hypothetical protein
MAMTMATAMAKRAGTSPGFERRVGLTSYLARSRGVSIAIVSGALLLAVLIVQNGIAGVARFKAPETALQWASGDARALAGAAELALTADADAAGRARAADLARAAIRRDPTLGTPFRVLGFVADAQGNRAGAKALIEHAALLSSRDLPTQLWLIDAAVARTDMTGALRHFDIALRTSTLAPAILFPVLGKALSEPDVVDALAGTLAKRPRWRDQFLADAIDKSPALEGLVRLSEQLAVRRHPLDAAQAQQLLTRLTEARAFALLARMRPAILPPAQRQALLLDPSFDAETEAFPFGWTLFDTSGLSARRVAAPDGSKRLRLAFRAETGRGGELLRQSLFLKPGSYRLIWSGGHDAADRLGAPVWSVTCPDTSPRSLLNADMMPTDGTTRGQSDFVVPTGCPGQWLQLAARANTSPQGLEGWIDRVAIIRR